MTAPTEVQHELNVDRGVALLDVKLGRDVWLPRLDAGRLDVASSDRCVACQATGERWYPDAVRVLGVNVAWDDEGVVPTWTERHGFGISWGSVGEGMPRDFAGLQAAWVRRIRQLRGKEVAGE